MQEKKKKWVNLLLWIGLGVLIAFVIITSIVVNYKQKEYNRIKKQNDIISGESVIRIVDAR